MRDAGRRAASEMPAGVGLDGRAEVGVVVGLEADERAGYWQLSARRRAASELPPGVGGGVMGVGGREGVGEERGRMMTLNSARGRAASEFVSVDGERGLRGEGYGIVAVTSLNSARGRVARHTFSKVCPMCHMYVSCCMVQNMFSYYRMCSLTCD